MLVNNVIFTLALFATSSIAAQPQDKCTPIQDISALESLSGWSEMQQWLTDNQLQSPTIGKGKGKYTSVTACIGSWPFEITPGTPRCLTQRRQTGTKNTTASGLVWFNTAPGFSTSADMTISKNAAFASDASSTVDLSLPSLGGHGAPVLASVAVLNTAGEKQVVPLPLVLRDANLHSCAVSPRQRARPAVLLMRRCMPGRMRNVASGYGEKALTLSIEPEPHTYSWENKRDASRRDTASSTQLRQADAKLESRTMLSARARQNLIGLVESTGEFEPAALEPPLKRRKQELDNLVSGYPILTLPPEVTSRIFLECIEPRPSTNSAPLLLLRICKSWRTIALSSPELWSKLQISSAFPPAMSSRDIAGIIDEWLGRACAVSIALSFYEPGMKKAGLALDLILPKHTWHLKHFHVHAAMHYASVFALEVPLPVLLSKNAAQLTTARKSNFGPGNRRRPRASMVIQTSLQYLALSRASGKLLGLLDLPALRSLAFVGMSSAGTMVPAFLARSSASLATFTYCGYSPSDSDGLSLEWFHIMRNLTVVALDAVGPELTRKCLLALNRETEVDLLPCLEVLEICQDNHNVDEPVIAALRSRYEEHGAQGGKSKLQVLRLLCSRPGEMVDRGDVGDVDWDALVQLSTLGMNIHVGTQSQNFLMEYDDSEGEE
ncbi:hypothetical protein DFH06DRAFT_1128511 [Mycena polygramma]|nr:hypothetical protein DFH06DRAFT_1128511 [Mycena polygramma]